MAMNILITGGSGNVGSWVTERLISDGHAVSVFSRESAPGVGDWDIERLIGDVRSISDLEKAIAMRRWDAVIHLASYDDTEGGGAPQTAILVNSLGTRNVLQVLSDRLDNAHFVYVSTFHVYGRSEGIITEELPPEPKSDYASTHLFAEYYIKQFHHAKGVPFTIFRLSNGYGAPKNLRAAKWNLALNDFSRMAYTKRAITLRSNGRAGRDYIWLGDVSDAISKCLDRGPSNDVLNLASGKSMTALNLAEIVRSVYREIYCGEIDIHFTASSGPADDERLVVSIDRLTKWIAFEPCERIREETIKLFKLLKGLGGSTSAT